MSIHSCCSEELFNSVLKEIVPICDFSIPAIATRLYQWLQIEGIIRLANRDKAKCKACTVVLCSNEGLLRFACCITSLFLFLLCARPPWLTLETSSLIHKICCLIGRLNQMKLRMDGVATSCAPAHYGAQNTSHCKR